MGIMLQVCSTSVFISAARRNHLMPEVDTGDRLPRYQEMIEKGDWFASGHILLGASLRYLPIFPSTLHHRRFGEMERGGLRQVSVYLLGDGGERASSCRTAACGSPKGLRKYPHC